MLPESLDCLRQGALERLPAHLAVGHHWEARPLLEFDRLVDRAILHPLEFGGGDGARCQTPPGLLQFRRAEQASHDVCPSPDHG